jgi:hypothetical protein
MESLLRGKGSFDLEEGFYRQTPRRSCRQSVLGLLCASFTFYVYCINIQSFLPRSMRPRLQSTLLLIARDILIMVAAECKKDKGEGERVQFSYIDLAKRYIHYYHNHL